MSATISVVVVAELLLVMASYEMGRGWLSRRRCAVILCPGSQAIGSSYSAVMVGTARRTESLLPAPDSN
ncbi:hypothetical protein Y717_24490 [Streptomyces scopuliridis RB72]|uniref:Uncharacterized protein n=1 Tax=Streptomyces scopuliridis RB72 TaxID=1440053 RepID=A0A2T7TD41_9ACTN|nr:hypothetical protein Y717_24490 [Streptomyces scopuliridis RB72]